MGDDRAGSLRTGRLEVLAAGLLWSLGGVLVKRIDAEPAVIAAARSLVAALVLAPFVRRAPARGAATILASTLTYTAVVGLFVWSTRVTTAANAILLQYTAPLWVFLLEWRLGRGRPGRRDVLTLAGGMAGIAILALGSTASDALGIAMALLSGMLFAVWMVLTHRARDLDPVAMTCVNNLGAAALLAPLALSGLALPSPGTWLALLAMGVVQLGLPYVLFSRGIRHVPAREAALIVLIEPVLNPIWVAIFAAETPGRATVLGGAVILATLALRYAPAWARA